ncbi:serine/arginine repetitive matrix protein 2 isoform X1 [Sebastes umbrosus]|uniref:serine/arginine repetitive matrix protein 2 isoform X1 n=1 Tax=Sebastes umbrosus TaxID=72105 RepID=UPI00189D38A4|nr:serine/arginine repetitive matrix protein 2 isoform X1 [Sebastes umbrosus]XP_037618481.1 serine/arginine repetitive matrix protein 2 isoform X1 [Sebastes umbrosus]
MDEQVNPLERDHSLSVVLPGGLEKNATVHGSKPVMDLLVTLCASYHLNPSDYTVEVLSPNKNNISFKPNSLIGSLEADTIVLKPKGTEEIKIRRPYMPEASVRLLINYNKSHKTVVRVNPRVPLEMLLPVVCDKCEFQVETTVLLRDSQSTEPLDLTKTLNEHGLREVFANDSAAKEPTDHHHRAKTPEAAAVTPTQVITPPPLQELPKMDKKQKDNAGFLSLFRRRKKTAGMDGAGSAPASLGLRVNAPVVSSSNTLPAETPKKRRAPQPPMGASTSLPNNLSSCHAGGSQISAESTLRRTKRRAPPPPCANNHLELQADTQLKGTVDSLITVEESDESDSVYLSLPSSSSTRPSTSSLRRFAHLHEVAEPYLPSFRGKDISDARCALAKVLTSSISKGTLVKRLRNSATFPKLYNGSFTMPTTPRCSNNGPFCAKPESFRTSNLVTEHEWEDPIQRKGMTTFKVVPSKTQKSHDPELTLDQIAVHDNPVSEASPELGRKTEEDPCSLDRSETETPLQSPEPSSQEIQTSPPPVLDLDNQGSLGSPLSEVGDIAEKQKEEDEPEPEVPSEVTVPSDCSDGEPTIDGQINSEECQSPTGQSESTDVDHCGSLTDEEEVVPEEEEEDNYFPPPPPPVFFNENIEVMEEKREDSTTSSPPSSQPPSSTSNGQTNAFSEDHQHEPTSAMHDQPAAAPRPPVKMSAAPSRFAQAVAMAVQRSRLHIGGKGLGPQAPSGPHSALPSPPRSTYQYGA